MRQLITFALPLLLCFSFECLAQVNNAPFNYDDSEKNHPKKDGELRVKRDVPSRFILNGKEVEAVPIANGCGTEDGLGLLLGRTGAAIDAAINTNVGLVFFPFSLATTAAAHAYFNSEEYQRLNEEICGTGHDVPYHEGAPKMRTDFNLFKGGAHISGLVVMLSGPLPKYGSNAAYRKAQEQAKRSRILEQELREQGEILPSGYFLREVPSQDNSPSSSAGYPEEGGHNLNAIVNTVFLFDDSIKPGEFVATEDDGFVYVRLNPSDLGEISREFLEAISSQKRSNAGFDGKSQRIRRREEVVPSTPRVERGLH